MHKIKVCLFRPKWGHLLLHITLALSNCRLLWKEITQCFCLHLASDVCPIFAPGLHNLKTQYQPCLAGHGAVEWDRGGAEQDWLTVRHRAPNRVSWPTFATNTLVTMQALQSCPLFLQWKKKWEVDLAHLLHLSNPTTVPVYEARAMEMSRMFPDNADTSFISISCGWGWPRALRPRTERHGALCDHGYP